MIEQIITAIRDSGILTVVVSLSILFLTISTILMFAVAFVQGRSVILWPPSVGEKPSGQDLNSDHRKVRDDLSGIYVPVESGTTLISARGASYTVGSQLYNGAYTTLYEATDENSEKVVVKIYWRGLKPNSYGWQQFEKEHRVADNLDHPNIVRVLDKGLRGGYPFLMVEYMAGGTLRDFLRERDRIPGRQIVSIASQLASALDFAHSMGVIHRDVKPGNVFFESHFAGRIALGDFGIAKIFEDQEKEMTRIATNFVGSAGYMAPEMMSFGESASSEAADVYSFGIILYEMFTGSVPFSSGRSVEALLCAKSEFDVPDVRSSREDIPEEVALRLSRALSRDPASRPTSARSLLAGMENLVEAMG